MSLFKKRLDGTDSKMTPSRYTYPLSNADPGPTYSAYQRLQQVCTHHQQSIHDARATTMDMALDRKLLDDFDDVSWLKHHSEELTPDEQDAMLTLGPNDLTTFVREAARHRHNYTSVGATMSHTGVVIPPRSPVARAARAACPHLNIMASHGTPLWYCADCGKKFADDPTEPEPEPEGMAIEMPPDELPVPVIGTALKETREKLAEILADPESDPMLEVAICRTAEQLERTLIEQGLDPANPDLIAAIMLGLSLGQSKDLHHDSLIAALACFAPEPGLTWDLPTS